MLRAAKHNMMYFRLFLVLVWDYMYGITCMDRCTCVGLLVWIDVYYVHENNYCKCCL